MPVQLLLVLEPSQADASIAVSCLEPSQAHASSALLVLELSQAHASTAFLVQYHHKFTPVCTAVSHHEPSKAHAGPADSCIAQSAQAHAGSAVHFQSITSSG
jgi:hypothetical protein